MNVTLDPAARRAVERCASCPKMCRGACPTLAVTHNERHQPWGHARTARSALLGEGGHAWSDPVLVDAAYGCATCGACTIPCAVEGVDTPSVSWSLRRAVAEAGAMPEPMRHAAAAARQGLVPLDARAETFGDPAPIIEALIPLAAPGASLLLFPGCTALGRRPEAVLAAARVLHDRGVAFVVPPRHVCCGGVARDAGDAEGVEAGVAAVAALVRPVPDARIATISGPCGRLLRERLEGVGVTPVVTDIAAALEGRPPPPPLERVAFHAACHVGRDRTASEAPRAALRAAALVAAAVEGADAGIGEGGPDSTVPCCGDGGGLAATHPGISAGYLARAAAAVQRVGSERLVCGDAACSATLARALPDVRVESLAETVAVALGLDVHAPTATPARVSAITPPSEGSAAASPATDEPSRA